ncbi:uncharacterized protein TrAtP1_002857 [Trichoderma atroviride]|uniref:uncharacterized protein n=1 Tax=Hypocrea atroviridis TaxID=63577 RepID=UPI00331B8772|nr:hypothetical protein TrAtP1_002857 [Trichoderma atroviride]
MPAGVDTGEEKQRQELAIIRRSGEGDGGPGEAVYGTDETLIGGVGVVAKSMQAPSREEHEPANAVFVV